MMRAILRRALFMEAWHDSAFAAEKAGQGLSVWPPYRQRLAGCYAGCGGRRMPGDCRGIRVGQIHPGQPRAWPVSRDFGPDPVRRHPTSFHPDPCAPSRDPACAAKSGFGTQSAPFGRGVAAPCPGRSRHWRVSVAVGRPTPARCHRPRPGLRQPPCGAGRADLGAGRAAALLLGKTLAAKGAL